MRPTTRFSTKLLGLCAVLALNACSESSNVGPDFEPEMAVVPVMVSAAPGLSTLVVEVTATDITTPLAYNLTMVDGTASDTITIPAGSDRTITVRGYDSNNIETHRGSTVTNLVEGSNTAVTVTLDPLAGDQPVVVVMGGVTVEISPAVDTVAVGSTIQLTGVVLNDQGDTLEVVPVWSTLNPAVATVDSTGLVTGVSAGSATIVGTYGGVGAQTIVTVFEPFFLAENGVTVVCTDAQVGDTGVVNGITYTKRDRAGLDALFAEGKSSGDYSPLANACTSGVTDMSWLTGQTDSFDQPIGSWDVSGVTTMRGMFMEAWVFNQPIGDWDVSSVTDMSDMFLYALDFNQPVGDWDVSNVTDMGYMFAGEVLAYLFDYETPPSPSNGPYEHSFNQPIGDWDVSSVTDMTAMFQHNRDFNQPIGEWDVSGVTRMGQMFHGARAFNQDIASWDVSNSSVPGFFKADSFNQDLSVWCVSGIILSPQWFDDYADAWTLPRPVWGTCSPASLFQSTLTASSTSIPADGASTVTITVQLKDVDGVNLTENSRTLTFDTPSQGSISAVTVNNDGTYTATYTVGSTAGTVTITANLDGVAMTQTVTITLN